MTYLDKILMYSTRGAPSWPTISAKGICVLIIKPVTKTKRSCPMDGNCNEWNIMYQAEVTTSPSKQTYIGLCDTSFKSRYRNHTCSFRNERYRNSTELSKYVWGLKDKKTDYQIRWRSIRHARSYSNVTKKCNLCLWEKYYIICRPNMATLNNRNELVSIKLQTCKEISSKWRDYLSL